jgi:protein associated with RNAse G/E
MAQEALELHIEGLLADKEILPKASSLESITSDKRYKSARAFFIVSAHNIKKRKVKFNATMDKMLLQKLDILANQIGKSRSEFLSDGVRMLIKEYQH